ncbi:MAG TPA: dTDP-4-dehydrorhamnose reductase [archaeon]|nr:dTDP-4-dehydrorhamnose reductase [archaeon]
MEKILVTGGSGLLGSKIVKLAGDNYEIIPTHHQHSLFSNSIEMNITKREKVFKVIQKFKPDVLIHAAGETDVDKCETDKKWAWKANVEGTKNIVEACSKSGARLIYISTDYIFDGQKGHYSENDSVNPVSYYGLTKLKGEEIIEEECEKYAIARASAIYGWHKWKLNFATWIISSLRKGTNINIVEDHYDSPTLADNLAELVLKIVDKKASGIYNTAGSERINRYLFALNIAKIFDLNKKLVTPIQMKDLKPWVAKRPRDSSLIVDKAQGEFGVKLLSTEEGLMRMKEQEERKEI